jgi:hypothetical protein
MLQTAVFRNGRSSYITVSFVGNIDVNDSHAPVATC